MDLTITIINFLISVVCLHDQLQDEKTGGGTCT